MGTFLCFRLTLKTLLRNIFYKKFESEVYVLHRLIQPGAICFDVGAAYGRYTLWISRLAQQAGRVYSFEPGTISFQVLKNIVRFHRLRNVVLVQKALSNCTGPSTLAIPVKKGKHLGLSLAHLGLSQEEKSVFEAIETVTLDDYCRRAEIPRVDFIKCDVEGAEGLVFQGAEETLHRYRPTVLCEIDQAFLTRFRSHVNEIQSFFRDRGYRIFRLANGKYFEEIKEIREPHNYFFIHPECENYPEASA